MIRDITNDDREIFLSMMKRFYSSAAVTHNVDYRNFEATFNEVLSKSPLTRAFIIECDGQPAGYAILAFTWSNESGGLCVFLEELYIDETYRGKGLARKFLEFVESEYPSATRFRLEVMEDNEHAIALYRKFGYSTLGYMQMVKDI